MSYTQEQIDRANQVNLEEFLRSQGEQFVTTRAKAAIPWNLSWSSSARASPKQWNC